MSARPLLVVNCKMFEMRLDGGYDDLTANDLRTDLLCRMEMRSGGLKI
jgi:hypothetical protein